MLLLCALALSVIGMHHVPLAPHGTSHATMSAQAMPASMTVAPVLPEVQPSGDHGTGTGHDLLHLCLVVLGAAGGVLLLAWLLTAVGAGWSAPSAKLLPPPWRTWRPPRTAGRSLLASICVLRT
jgi:hypothetical protein